jgi:hypothetical protein
MMQMMMMICRQRTQKPSHSSDAVSKDEQTQFSNCIMKFMELPKHLQQSMEGAQF